MNRPMAVLSAVIQEYILTAAPVGSRAIRENHHFQVSPATIRNDLSRLEGDGYLLQPHTSAGRIPTDLGYRVYVDHALEREEPRAAEDGFARWLECLFASEDSERGSELQDRSAQQAADSIARALSSMTSCLAVVVDPVERHAKVVRISLVPTADANCVVVVVLDTGSVETRQVSIYGVTPDALHLLEAYLNSVYVGQDISSLEELDNTCSQQLRQVAQDISHVVRNLLADRQEALVTTYGIGVLLGHPEFQDVEQTRYFVSALEDDVFDFNSLCAQESQDLIVRIGGENPDSRLSHISFVAKEFKVGDKVGLVGCIGPTRMDYVKIISAVEAGAHQAVQAWRHME